MEAFKEIGNLSFLNLICIAKIFNFVIIVVEKTTKMEFITLNLFKFQSVGLLCSFFFEDNF